MSKDEFTPSQQEQSNKIIELIKYDELQNQNEKSLDPIDSFLIVKQIKELKQLIAKEEEPSKIGDLKFKLSML